MKKLNYGIDAPKVIRNLLGIGALLLIISLFLWFGLFPQINFLKLSFLSTAICLIIAGLLMIAYSKYGKFRHRDRILKLHQWKGDEKVLDVGAGLYSKRRNKDDFYFRLSLLYKIIINSKKTNSTDLYSIKNDNPFRIPFSKIMLPFYFRIPNFMADYLKSNLLIWEIFKLKFSQKNMMQL